MYSPTINIVKKGILLAVIATAVIVVAIVVFSSGKTGTINLYLTDAPPGVNITSVIVTLSDIQVHYAGSNSANVSENNTLESGWKTVVTGPVTYDLLTVKDAIAFLGSTEVQAGKYTQIRLNVESAKVTIDGQEQNLTISSGTIKIVRSFDVVAGEEIKLTLDFDAEDSIVVQGNNMYRMHPTIKLL